MDSPKRPIIFYPKINFSPYRTLNRSAAKWEAHQLELRISKSLEFSMTSNVFDAATNLATIGRAQMFRFSEAFALDIDRMRPLTIS